MNLPQTQTHIITVGWLPHKSVSDSANISISLAKCRTSPRAYDPLQPPSQHLESLLLALSLSFAAGLSPLSPRHMLPTYFRPVEESSVQSCWAPCWLAIQWGFGSVEQAKEGLICVSLEELLQLQMALSTPLPCSGDKQRRRAEPEWIWSTGGRGFQIWIVDLRESWDEWLNSG